ncbi:hypothetical protein U1Q18_032532, partial [Sarracenia purpurea var. burkii]
AVGFVVSSFSGLLLIAHYVLFWPFYKLVVALGSGWSCLSGAITFSFDPSGSNESAI